MLTVSLQRGRTLNTTILDMTLNCLMMRLQSWSLGNVEYSIIITPSKWSNPWKALIFHKRQPEFLKEPILIFGLLSPSSWSQFISIHSAFQFLLATI